MTFKLKELFDIKYISQRNISKRSIIEELEVHNILNINNDMRNQFMLIISTYHNDVLVIHIFKKYFTKKKTWSQDKLQYLNSICLSENSELKYDWKNIDNVNIDEECFIIDETYDRSILAMDYDFYINIKTCFKNFNESIRNELENKVWGKTYHIKSIIWQVFLGNIVTMYYGSGIDENNFRTKDFKKDIVNKIYYKNYDIYSIVYKKFVDNKLVYCDICHNGYKIINNTMYNLANFGDLCNVCFREKKKKEDFRKTYFKNFILSKGREKIFRQQVEYMRDYLEKNPIKELDNSKKYELMKKFNTNLLKNTQKKNECSICLEEMTKDIYAGGCGHCFHEMCYFKFEDNKCPLCRSITNFKKLHL